MKTKQSNETALAEREQLPMETIMRTMKDHTEVRLVKIMHPFRHSPCTAVPYLDLARAFSYDESAIRKMIHRTPWIKKHSVQVIMSGADGKFYPHLCLLKEAATGILFKIQPERCKDPDIAAHIDQRQEELIYIVEDALTGKQTMTVDDYKKIRLAADLIPRIAKTDDHDLKELLYQQLEATVGHSVPRPVKKLPLFDRQGEGKEK